MSPRNFVGLVGIVIFLLGPVACFLTWAVLGRDGGTASAFAMIFLGMGVIIFAIGVQMEEGH